MRKVESIIYFKFWKLYDHPLSNLLLYTTTDGGAPDESVKQENDVMTSGDAVEQSNQSESTAFLHGASSGSGGNLVNQRMDNESEEDEDDDDFFGNLGPSSKRNKSGMSDNDGLGPDALGLGKPTLINRQVTDPAQHVEEEEVGMDEIETKIPENKIKSVRERERERESGSNKYDVESELDRNVKNALITKDYRSAMNLSLNAGNIADALVFAYYGGSDLWEYAKKAYFTQHRQEFVANTFKYIANVNFGELVEKSV